MLTISHHIISFFLSRYTYLLLSTNFETAASTASVPSIRRELSIGYTLFSSQVLEKSYQQHIISVSFSEKKNVVFTPKTAQNQNMQPHDFYGSRVRVLKPINCVVWLYLNSRLCTHSK